MRHAQRINLFALVVVATAGLVLPSQAFPRSVGARDAATTRQQMREAQRARAAELGASRQAGARASLAAEAERRLGTERVAAAARLRQTEVDASDLAERLEQLEKDRRDIETRIQLRVAEMAPLLPVIERLSRFPAETLLAAPTDPDTALTGVLVLRGLARQLEADAAVLARERQALDFARARIAAQSPLLATARAAQAAQAAELDSELAAARANRRQAGLEADEAARHAAEFSARAENLRAVIVDLEAERQKAEVLAQAEARRDERHQRMAAASKNPRRQAPPALVGVGALATAVKPGSRLLTPVVGAVIRKWGDPGEGGPSTGMAFRTIPGGRVVAPCGGRVVFGQPFRSFGLLMIVDCGGGYHAVLSGLSRLDVAVGQSVQAGEPVGVMAPERSGELYIELRNNGQAVNPAPWLHGKLSNSS